MPLEQDPLARWQAKSTVRDFIHALETQQIEQALSLCTEYFWLEGDWLQAKALKTQFKTQSFFQNWELESLSYYSPEELNKFGYHSPLAKSQRPDAYMLVRFQRKTASENASSTYTSILFLRFKQGQWKILGTNR